jgi:hypothetical protein
VMGYVEPGVEPIEQAWTEVREELGLQPPDVWLVRSGPILPLTLKITPAGPARLPPAAPRLRRPPGNRDRETRRTRPQSAGGNHGANSFTGTAKHPPGVSFTAK